MLSQADGGKLAIELFGLVVVVVVVHGVAGTVAEDVGHVELFGGCGVEGKDK